MSTSAYDRLLEEIEALPLAERVRLIDQVNEGIRRGARRKRHWREFIGSVPYPALGEDAQAWITRSRREDDGLTFGDEAGRP